MEPHLKLKIRTLGMSGETDSDLHNTVSKKPVKATVIKDVRLKLCLKFKHEQMENICTIRQTKDNRLKTYNNDNQMLCHF